jgi:hypothetical protein
MEISEREKGAPAAGRATAGASRVGRSRERGDEVERVAEGPLTRR